MPKIKTTPDQITTLSYIPENIQGLQSKTTEKVKQLSTEDLIKLYKEYNTFATSAKTDIKDFKSGINWFKELDLTNIKRLRDEAGIDKKELRSLMHKVIAQKGKESDIPLDNWASRQAINYAMGQKGLRHGGFHPTSYYQTQQGSGVLTQAQLEARQSKAQYDAEQNAIREAQIQNQRMSFQGPISGYGGSQSVGGPSLGVNTPVVTQQPQLLMGSESAQSVPFIQKGGGFRQYEAGGVPTSMYGSNVIPGSMGSTSSIVFQETEDARLEEEEKKLEELKADESWMNKAVERSTKQKTFDQALGLGTQTLKSSFDQWGKEKGFKNWAEYLKDRAAKKLAEETALKTGEETVKAAGTELLKTGTEEVGTEIVKEAGSELATTAGTELATTAGTELATTAGTELAKTAGTELVQEGVKEGGKGLIKSMATSTANISPYAAAANVIGKGISMGSDDQDPTTWTEGEATGDVLGSMGEYAGYGATLGSIVPGVGNVIGGVVGGVVGLGKGLYEGLANRKRAREEKKEHDLDVLAQSDARDVEFFRKKRYSGFDFGQDITSRYGGPRNKGSRLRTIQRYNLA